jgi:hypothetical protein
MPKSLSPHWLLQQIAETQVAHLAPARSIIPIVRFRQDQIVWDEECPGVGSAPWHVDYFVAPGDSSARTLIPALNAAIAPYQELYDLGLTCG